MTLNCKSAACPAAAGAKRRPNATAIAMMKPVISDDSGDSLSPFALLGAAWIVAQYRREMRYEGTRMYGLGSVVKT